MLTVFELQIRSFLRGPRVAFLVLVLSIPVALSFMIKYFEGLGSEEADAVALFVLYPMLFCVMLSMLHGSSLLSGEVERKTIAYLFTRPLGKWQVIVGKYLAIVLALGLAVTSSYLAAWYVIGSPLGWSVATAELAACWGSIMAYTAVFTLLGTMVFRRPMVLGLLYALFDVMVSLVPAVIRDLTISYHLRSLTLRIGDFPELKEVSELLGGAPLARAIVVPPAVAIAGLILSSLLASHREFAPAEEV